MKIVKSLEESGLLIKDVSETIKKWSKRTKKQISQYIFGRLGASLLGNLFTSNSTIRAGESTIRAGRNF